MEQSSEKRKKTKQSKSPTVSDSSYGSMITGTSSSSSLSLSLFSESDLAEGPSTSGCSSEMATAMRTKEKKKERAKEFMKKLKSMLPNKKTVGKMDTLSTLEQLVDSMKQLSENEKKHSEFKTPPPHTGSYHSVDSDKLSQSNMYISVSPKSHVVQTVSTSLMEHLGYPVDWWKGRLLKDFLKKKDINTVNSCLAQHSADDDCGEISESIINSNTGGALKEGSKYFYARIRRFRKLGEGFNLQNVVSYCPFRMMITSKPLDMSDSEEDGAGRHRRSLIIYCSPLASAYPGGGLPDQKKFSLRHSLFCNFTYIDPNAVSLLGFLPQDLNGKQIFDLYHPDSFPMLLDVHKKIMLSMGQPFKSDAMKLRTLNGCYVEVETEWSSFINPLSMRLEFIIGQHTVLKAPASLDLFEDVMISPEKFLITPEICKIQEKILEVLKKPIQKEFAEPSPLALPARNRVGPPPYFLCHKTTWLVEGCEVYCDIHQSDGTGDSEEPKRRSKRNERTEGPSLAAKATVPMIVEPKESDSTAKSGTTTEKSKDESSSAESKSAVIDEKGISSIYNQLNYSHNIKRFLMSHPKSFSNVSDEDSVMMRDDSEDENINEEEELPLEIPVVKPPSCGSSTQVHVSEPGHGGEDIASVPPFGEETSNPPRETAADSRHSLTEETLKKHTKMQERLYLQRISEEQPLLLNMRRRVKKSRNTSHQKRPRPKEAGEDVDSAKHPCTNSGVFRSSSNIFLQSFPVIKETELPPTAVETDTMFDQTKVESGGSFNNSYMGQQGTQISFQAFSQGYQAGNQGSLGVPQQPAIHLVPGEAVPISCIPTSLTSMLPTQGLVDMGAAGPRQNIQWPYYPQAGYTLLPQVMAGFYQPMLQPVQMSQGPFMQAPSRPSPTAQAQRAQDSPESGENAKHNQIAKKANYSDNNQSSSVEDTTSSIMYLLDADSSTFEDSDNKHSVPPGPPRWIQNKPAREPPWLSGVNWNTDTKMRYQLPQTKMFTVLKMDEKMIKKTQQSDLAQLNLEQLLEDVAAPDYFNNFDEEADYIFFPGDEPLEDSDLSVDKCDELEMTQPQISVGDRVPDGGGKGRDKGGGGAAEVGQTEDVAEVEIARAKEDDQAVPALLESSSNIDEGQAQEVVWTLAQHQEPEDENSDTPTKGQSEDEKSEAAPSASPEGEKKVDSIVMKREDKTTEDHGDSGDIAMETVFCSTDRHAGRSESSLALVTKRGSSPKDGSLSGDECSGSDGGQKIEMEDAQSSCSKESSDLTPSEVRSNEEAGSSLKESDSSLKLVKGGPSGSVASPSSSTDQMVQEDVGSGARTGTSVADLEEVFQKLFVPLKVRVSNGMSQRGKTGSAGREAEGGSDTGVKRFRGGASSNSAPYWLLEAHMSKRVAMAYKVPSRQLEDVLSEDRRRMTDLVQSSTVRQQLLQLLSEVDFKTGSTPCPASNSAIDPASSVPSPVMNSSTDVSANDSIPLLSVSPTVQSPPTQSDIQIYTDCFTAKKLVSDCTENTDNSMHSEEQDKKPVSPSFFKELSHNKEANAMSMSPFLSVEENMNISEDSMAESKSMKFSSLRPKSVSHVSMESVPVALIGGEDSSPTPQHLYSREMVFSDTNSEPVGDKFSQDPRSQSSSTDINLGCDSAGDDSMGVLDRRGRAYSGSVKSKSRRQDAASKAGVTKMDSHLNERFQSLESKCLGGQSIEDIIMSKVFLTSEPVVNTGVESRSTPDLRGNIELLD